MDPNAVEEEEEQYMDPDLLGTIRVEAYEVKHIGEEIVKVGG